MIKIQRLIEHGFNSSPTGVCFHALKISFTFLCNDTMDIKDLRRKLAGPLSAIDGFSDILVGRSFVVDIDADIPTYSTSFTVFVTPKCEYDTSRGSLLVFNEDDEKVVIDGIEEVISECCGRLQS